MIIRAKVDSNYRGDWERFVTMSGASRGMRLSPAEARDLAERLLDAAHAAEQLEIPPRDKHGVPMKSGQELLAEHWAEVERQKRDADK